MKRRYILAVAIMAVLVTAFLGANAVAGSCGGAETVLLNCDSSDGEGAFIDILSNVFHIFSVGVGILAVIGIVVTGIMYMTARDNSEQVMKAKRRIYHVVIGVLAYVLMFGVIEFLLPGENKLIHRVSEESGENSSTSASESEIRSRSDSSEIPSMEDGSEPDAPERGNSPTGDEGWIDRLEQ